MRIKTNDKKQIDKEYYFCKETLPILSFYSSLIYNDQLNILNDSFRRSLNIDTDAKVIKALKHYDELTSTFSILEKFFKRTKLNCYWNKDSWSLMEYSIPDTFHVNLKSTCKVHNENIEDNGIIYLGYFSYETVVAYIKNPSKDKYALNGVKKAMLPTEIALYDNSINDNKYVALYYDYESKDVIICMYYDGYYYVQSNPKSLSIHPSLYPNHIESPESLWSNKWAEAEHSFNY